MSAEDLSLKDCFQRELRALREDAEEFARANPEVARALTLHKGEARDPHVEMLIQSFAWLTGRLAHEMEQDRAVLPNALLESLYPHLAAPIPCMTVAEIQVRPDGANFAKGASLARGRLFRAEAADPEGRRVACRFSVTQDTPLWPLRVAGLSLGGVAESRLGGERPGVHGVLTLTLRAQGGETLAGLAPGRLRFYLDGQDSRAYALYELLALRLTGLALAADGAPTRELRADRLTWTGYTEAEAALPEHPQGQPGYRLLQEYFAFPEKFLFFEVEGLDFTGVGGECQLLFLLDAPPGRALAHAADLVPELIRLNCVPLINLYPTRLEPVRLDHRRHEYRLSADSRLHDQVEVHGVLELTASRPGAAARPLAPWFVLEEGRHESQPERYFFTRREAASGVAGCDLHVSFLDLGEDAATPREEVVGGRVLCDNRRLPEKLRLGDALQLEGPGPVESAAIIMKPSPHHAPALIGAAPWELAAQLSLNHLSLAGGPRALAALKDLLRRHVGPAAELGAKQIDGLYRLDCRPCVRHLGGDAWRGFVPALELRLHLDRHHFDGASPVLFAAVLRHFLALHAAVNSVVEVSLETRDGKGTLKTWPPLCGAQPIL